MVPAAVCSVSAVRTAEEIVEKTAFVTGQCVTVLILEVHILIFEIFVILEGIEVVFGHC